MQEFTDCPEGCDLTKCDTHVHDPGVFEFGKCYQSHPKGYGSFMYQMNSTGDQLILSWPQPNITC